MKTAYEIVKGARSKDRHTGQDFIDNVFSGFTELHGDRRFADDPSVVGGLAMLGDTPFTVIATEKGHDLKNRMHRNFGMANPEGYRKAMRLMKQAEKFNRPVVCFVDTCGAFPGIGAEERGQGSGNCRKLNGNDGVKDANIVDYRGRGWQRWGACAGSCQRSLDDGKCYLFCYCAGKLCQYPVA